MIRISLGEIAERLSGRLYNIAPEQVVLGHPRIDSRAITPGDFFIALTGEQADGNSYAGAAIAAGAIFAIVTDPVVASEIPSILVEDGAAALWELAKTARNQLSHTLFIGITGSQGKTTTKDLLRQILASSGTVVAPVGSFNNELGVPLTILGCDEQTRYCIVEMGARHVGDIALLCELAKPSIGAVLGIGNAHLGEFGSREQIALAKGELIRALPATGTAVLGNYDELAPHLADGLSLKVFTFGESTSCQIRATDVEFRGGASAFELVTPGGRAPVELALIGLHQIANALAAAALAFAAGISTEVIAAGLSMASAESKWRMALSEAGHVVLLNDSYNANPESMSAALKTLALLAQERGGRAWAFLGKMHELGESERQEHLAIGKLASDLGVDHLVSIGTDLFINGLELNPESDELWTHYLLTQEEALGMTKYLLPGDVVLIKASRAEHLDELAEAMTAALLAVEEVI